MRNSVLLSLCLYLSLGPLLGSCALRPEEPTAPRALPVSWYQLPENGAPADGAENPSPGSEADASVRTAFKAHLDALGEPEEPSERPQTTGMMAMMATPGEAARTTPWHLDGMIADFAVSVNGLFGVLLGGGTASTKITWKQARPHADAEAPASRARPASLKVTARTTPDDVLRQLEPVVRSATRSGAVRDETSFRKNLFQRGQAFYSLCDALSAVPRFPGWKINSFQLQLSFDASGQVVPFVSVGGGIIVYFDWQKPVADTISPAPAQAESQLTKSMRAFLTTLAADASSAAEQSTEPSVSGFVFDQFQVGLAISAQGRVGIAQTQGSAQGKLIFQRTRGDEAPAPDNLSAPIDLVGGSPLPEHLAYANLVGTTFERESHATSGESVIYHLEHRKFLKGLQHALSRASYFAQKARLLDTRHWSVKTVEAEFDASIGGDLKVAQVTGAGEIVIDLDRAN